MQAETLLADKAFDADERVIEPLRAAGKNPVIPPKSNRKVPRAFDKELYKARTGGSWSPSATFRRPKPRSLLRHTGTTSHGGVTQTNRPPANPGRFRPLHLQRLLFRLAGLQAGAWVGVR
jgi:hypothetical protein